MILKLVIITIIFAVIIIYLKQINPEIAMLATVCAGGILLMFAVDMLSSVISLYERISEISGLGEGKLKIIVKVTIIAYIIEFSAGIIEEFGMKSLADKLVFIGKILIILLAVPILEAMLKLIEGLL